MKTGQFDYAIDAYLAHEAEAKKLVEASAPVEAEEDIFDVLEREQREASIAKHVETEFGSLEAMDKALDAEFAGQKPMTADEMMAHLRDYAAKN